MGEADAGTPSFEMTWSSTTSSGYCSQEDSDSELEQYFTARTSLVRRPRRDQVGAGGGGQRAGAVTGTPPLPGEFPCREFTGSPALPSAGSPISLGPAGGTWVSGSQRLGTGCLRPVLCHRLVEPGEAATWLGVDQGRAFSAHD